MLAIGRLREKLQSMARFLNRLMSSKNNQDRLDKVIAFVLVVCSFFYLEAKLYDNLT